MSDLATIRFQQARVQSRGPGIADVAGFLRGPALRIDELPDRGGLAPPPLDVRRWDVPRLRQPQRPVERDPAHGLGLRVVAWRSADLPDAGVRVSPPLAHEVGDEREIPPDVGAEAVARAGVDERGVQQLAVGVELELIGGAVADAYR